MNTTKVIATYLGLSLTCWMYVSQAAYAGVAGYTQFVNGNVQIIGEAGQPRALQKGGAVNEGDTVISAKGASAQIKMQDGGFVAMRPDTRLKFDSFKFNGKEDGSERAVFSLLKGGFRSVTGLIGRLNKPNYRITTAAATIGIRGTDHETFVVTPDSSLANAAPTGTYNKVNVGETFMTTDKGTIFVLPNHMGFAGASDQMPELKPLNTDIFTVADKPAKDAKGDKDGRKEVRETAKADRAAEEGGSPEAGIAIPAMEGVDTDILQPITTKDGTHLTGGDTASGGSTPTGGPFAAYTLSDTLIEVASPNFFSRNSMAAPTDITYTGSGLSSFIDRQIVDGGSSSYTVIGGTSPLAGTATSFNTTGIQFGRWSSVTALESSYTTPLGSTNWQAPSTWMYGPQGYLDTGIMAPPGVAAAGQMYGTFNYVLDGQVPVHDMQSGRSGSLTSASLTANFTNNSFSANLALSVGGQAWSASATNVNFNGSQFFANSYPGGTANNLIVSTGAGTPTACPTCFGSLNGAFTGLNYAGAILSYSLWDNGNIGAEVFGQAAFARDPLVTITSNGTGVPTGFYVVATDSGNNGSGNFQLLNTLSTTGGVLTAYSSGNSANPANGYMATTVTCSACTVSAPTANTANTGIYYGTWDAGSYTQTFGYSISSASPHWITGPEAGPLFLANALIGTKTFILDGGMVTNSNGVAGTVTGTTLTVDFTRQVVGINLNLSVPGLSGSHTWNAQTVAGNEAIINGSNGIGGATFQASSYNNNFNNNAGSGLLTVTVDGASPGNGNVSGELTGTGLNGAILSYSLNASLPSFSFEQVNGVAALVGATSDIITPHREVMMSLTDPTSIIAQPVLGFYANNADAAASPPRMVTDGAGNLTRFDMNTINNGGSNASITLNSGSSVLANTGNDPLTGISWGRWDGGSVNATNRATGVVTTHALAGSLHWIAGPTETAAVTLPLSGSYTYINAGGTTPTDNLSHVGTLNSATLSADFTAQTVNVGVNVTVAGSTLAATAANVPIIQRTAFYADSQTPQTNPAHLAVTCTGSCGTSTQGAILGNFVAPGATGAMMSYGLQNISASSTQVISGVAAFHR